MASEGVPQKRTEHLALGTRIWANSAAKTSDHADEALRATRSGGNADGLPACSANAGLPALQPLLKAVA